MWSGPARPAVPATHHPGLARPPHLLPALLLGLLLKEGADLLEGGSVSGLQRPAGLHDAVSETGQRLSRAWGSLHTCNPYRAPPAEA